MKSIVALFHVTRPLNTAIAAISVLLIPAIAQSPSDTVIVLLAVFSVMLVAAGGNVINDYFDIETDRINKPERALVVGLVSPRAAWYAWIGLSMAGVVSAASINTYCFMIALIAVIGLWIYSFRLKRTLLWGNACVSMISGLTFLFAGFAVGDVNLAWIPAGFATLFHFGREILKDMEDMEGDRIIGAQTLPLQNGVGTAKRTVVVVFGLLLMLTPIPFLTDQYGAGYLICITGLFFPIILITMISLWRNHSPENLNRLSKQLKAAMLIGLLSIWVG